MMIAPGALVLGPAVGVEEAMVSLGDASAQPGAVVIVDRNATK